jgi:hypothetical protein
LSTSSVIEQLLKIDSVVEPGVGEDQFQQLFAKCRACRVYMTRRTTPFHHCKLNADPDAANNIVDFIDLTEEEV